MRQEKLKIDQDPGCRPEYAKDVAKLESALARTMEETLFKASHVLGFQEVKNFKPLLTDPKFYLSDANHLVIGKRRGKLQDAKQELMKLEQDFNNFESLSNNNSGDTELRHLAAIAYFLRGVIDEAENDFISADMNYQKAGTYNVELSSFIQQRQKRISQKIIDQYLFQAPLNWPMVKHFYENQLKKDKSSVNLFVKLAYINAKFGDFAVSCDYFKKAYELSEDIDLRKSKDYFKSRRTFLYPDDMRLIPQQFMKQYPILQEISFFEVKNLLNRLGIEVVAKSNGFIGRTGIRSPADVIIRSAGFLVGNYGLILINGKNVSQNKKGYNIIVLNSATGEVETSENFNTSESKFEVERLMHFISSIEKNKIVCVSVCDEASGHLSSEYGKIFQRIGAKDNLHGKVRWGHGVIGVKGATSGEAIEAISEKPLEIYVTKYQSGSMPQ